MIISPRSIIISGGGYESLISSLSPSARYILKEASGTTMVAAVGTDGIYGSGGGLGSPVFGQVGAIASLSQTSTRFIQTSMQFGNSASATGLPIGAATLIAWIRLSTIGTVQSIVSNGGVGYNWGLQILASGKLQLFWFNGVSAYNQTQTSNTVLTPGLWYMVAASITAGSTPTVTYTVNGVTDGGGTGIGIFTSGTGLQVAALVGDQMFDGWMNDVMIIPSTVPVATLLNIYNLGKKTLVSLTSVTHISGISAKWLFDTNFNGTPSTTTGNLAALEVNASGVGFLAPSVAGTVGSNFVQPSYAGATLAGNAWRILSDPLILDFGSDHYLQVPSSGTLA